MNRYSIILPATLAALAAACGGEGEMSAKDTPGDFGTIAAALENVPAGVTCVKLSLRGPSTLSPSFTVSAMQRSVLQAGALGPGRWLVSGQAFDVACASVTGSTVPSWQSQVVGVNVVPGATVRIPLVLRRNVNTAVSVQFQDVVDEVSAVGNTTFARIPGGKWLVWGANFQGLATYDPTTVDNILSPRPLAPTLPNLNLASIAQSATAWHACGIASDATVWCWGHNIFGNLGRGTTTTREQVPAQVPNLTNIITVAVGYGFSCAASGDGRRWCWGKNDNYQFGNNSTTGSSSPVEVSDGNKFVELAAGLDHACGRDITGSVHCWGNGDFGEHCVAPTVRQTPVAIGSVQADSIALAEEGTCVLRSDRTVACCGRNTYGALGNGTDLQTETLTPVAHLGEVVSLRLNHFGGCALTADRSVHCWGYNSFGQVGDGGGGDRFYPTLVDRLGYYEVAALTSGKNHSCVVMNDGTPRCWGGNFYGAVGDGTMIHRARPVSPSW